MAVIALLVVRPAAIAISLLGEKLRWESVAYLGWFGPRGLATVVFYLLAVEEVPSVPVLVTDTVVAAVTLSILLHGVSAVPVTKWCAKRWAGMTEDMPEMMETLELPTRRG
jgi:NhaP-type Na+/H+ or K+/H+ antiporter